MRDETYFYLASIALGFSSSVLEKTAEKVTNSENSFINRTISNSIISGTILAANYISPAFVNLMINDPEIAAIGFAAAAIYNLSYYINDSENVVGKENSKRISDLLPGITVFGRCHDKPEISTMAVGVGFLGRITAKKMG